MLGTFVTERSIQDVLMLGHDKGIGVDGSGHGLKIPLVCALQVCARPGEFCCDVNMCQQCRVESVALVPDPAANTLLCLAASFSRRAALHVGCSPQSVLECCLSACLRGPRRSGACVAARGIPATRAALLPPPSTYWLACSTQPPGQPDTLACLAACPTHQSMCYAACGSQGAQRGCCATGG